MEHFKYGERAYLLQRWGGFLAEGLRRIATVLKTQTPLNLDDAPSTARECIARARAEGMSAADLRPKDLEKVYASLNSWKDAPDLEGARAALPVGRAPTEVAGLSCLIVETRRHRNLPFVIRQAHDILGVPIHLVHGPDNREFILKSNLYSLIKSRYLFCSELRISKINLSIYNGLLLSPEFWRMQIGRGKIIVMQTDAVFCRSSPYSIEQFLTLDYVGAAWNRNRPIGIRIDGGNGGFSLRDWTMTMTALERFPARSWPGGEDGYFGFHIELIGGRVGSPAECERFCTQFRFGAKSFGAHKLNGLGLRDRLRFLLYCPASLRLLF